jgi:integrase
MKRNALPKDGERRTWGTGSAFKSGEYMVATVEIKTSTVRKQLKRKVKIIGTGIRAEEAAATKAVEKVQQELARRDEGLAPSDRSMTVAKWAECWLTLEAGLGTYQPTTLKHNSNIIKNYITPSIGNVQLDKVDVQTVDRALLALRDRGLSQETIGKARGMMSLIFKEAVRTKRLATNPVRDARSVTSKAAPKEKKGISEEEGNLLLKASGDSQIEAAVHLGLLAVLRPGEALGLQWDDVDQKKMTIHVHASLAYLEPQNGGRRRSPDEVAEGLLLKDTKNKESVRVIGVSDELLKVLEQVRLRQKQEAFSQGMGSGQGFVAGGPTGAPRTVAAYRAELGKLSLRGQAWNRWQRSRDHRTLEQCRSTTPRWGPTIYGRASNLWLRCSSRGMGPPKVQRVLANELRACKMPGSV